MTSVPPLLAKLSFSQQPRLSERAGVRQGHLAMLSCHPSRQAPARRMGGRGYGLAQMARPTRRKQTVASPVCTTGDTS